MARRRRAGILPQPPWSYAPSEVAGWLASTAGPSPRREPRSARQIRVKSFVGRCPTAAEGRLLRRLAELGFERTEGPFSQLPLKVMRRMRPTDREAFLGKLGDVRVHILLRKGATLRLRITFAPRVSSHRASKFLSRLGVRSLEGTWT